MDSSTCTIVIVILVIVSLFLFYKTVGSSVMSFGSKLKGIIIPSNIVPSGGRIGRRVVQP